MKGPEERVEAGAMRPLGVALLAVALAAAGLALWLRSSEPSTAVGTNAGTSLARPAEAGDSEPGRPQREISPGVFEPGSDGKLTLRADAIARGGAIQVELPLAPREIGDEPMSATIRSAGRTYTLEPAALDASGARAVLSIDAKRLPPGHHLVAIRVADGSWNPHRRIMITVSED